jgi:hypothetical protein
MSEDCSWINSAHYSRWHGVWWSMCSLSLYFTKPLVLWHCKDIFRGNSVGSRYQQHLQSVMWYRSLNYLVVSVTARKLWQEGTGQQICRTVLLVYMKCCFWVQDVSSLLVSKDHQCTPVCNGISHCILTKFSCYRCSLQPRSSRDTRSVRTPCSIP